MSFKLAQTIFRDNIHDVWKSLLTSHDDSGIKRQVISHRNCVRPIWRGLAAVEMFFKLQRIQFQAGVQRKWHLSTFAWIFWDHLWTSKTICDYFNLFPTTKNCWWRRWTPRWCCRASRSENVIHQRLLNIMGSFRHGHCGILRWVVNISVLLHQELLGVDKINTKLMMLCDNGDEY